MKMTDFFFDVPAFAAQTPEWPGVLTIAERLRGAGFQAYLVGGAVRDLLLGERPKDFDVATDAVPEEIQRLFPKAIPLGASFGVVTVIENGIPYEVATFREERDYQDGRHPETVHYTHDPALDAARRDFTINALFYDPLRRRAVDFTGGLEDLRKGVLRTVGNAEQRFLEDHLRMLRAVRFAARLNCAVDPELFAAVRKLAGKIVSVSPERIRTELEKMLLHRSREKAFRLLAETGLLREVLPEVDALRGVTQPPAFHPEGDVFEHTMLMLTHIAWPTPALVWSVLLHDIAKPLTRTVKDGIPHFYGHESEGAPLAEAILKRLRLPNSVIDSVVPAVRNHMRFAHIDLMRPARWKRIAADPNFPLELELHRIDCISSNGLLGNYFLMLERLRQMEKESSAALPPPLVTGRDLIALGMRPGVALGNLLREISDRQLEDELTTKADALKFASERLRQSE